MKSPANSQLATFAAGCFWCYEPIFRDLRGVIDVQVGYTGGSVPHPTYEQVSTGTSGHVEAMQVTFDPAQISYPELLEVFWHVHDPTTLNRQGADTGPQYRSAIFFHNPQQQAAAEQSKAQAQANFSDPIVTEIVPLTQFYAAEDYHQQYFSNNPSQPYCQVVIGPKIKKFRDKYRHLLKQS